MLSFNKFCKNKHISGTRTVKKQSNTSIAVHLSTSTETPKSPIMQPLESLLTGSIRENPKLDHTVRSPTSLIQQIRYWKSLRGPLVVTVASRIDLDFRRGSFSKKATAHGHGHPLAAVECVHTYSWYSKPAKRSRCHFSQANKRPAIVGTLPNLFGGPMDGITMLIGSISAIDLAGFVTHQREYRAGSN